MSDREKDFFAGFDPPTLKIDPIGPTNDLRARVQELEDALRAFREAFKEPDGGHWFWLRKVAERYGIYAEDLGRDRILFRIADAVLAQPSQPRR